MRAASPRRGPGRKSPDLPGKDERAYFRIPLAPQTIKTGGVGPDHPRSGLSREGRQDHRRLGFIHAGNRVDVLVTLVSVHLRPRSPRSCSKTFLSWRGARAGEEGKEPTRSTSSPGGNT